MHRHMLVFVAGILCAFLTGAEAAKVSIPEIPDAISGPERTRLQRERQKIVTARDKLNEQIRKFNAECREIPEDSPKVQECGFEQDEIKDRKLFFKEDIDWLTKEIASNMPQKSAAPVGVKIKVKPQAPPQDAPRADALKLGAKVAGLVLDAIEHGGHDLDKSDMFMRDLLKGHPADRDIRDASSYITGMMIGNGMAGNPPPEMTQDQLAKQARMLPLGAQYDLAGFLNEREDAFMQAFNSIDLGNWMDERDSIYLNLSGKHSDFSAQRQELEKRLQHDPGNDALRAALRMTQGAEVYQGDINRRNGAPGLPR